MTKILLVNCGNRILRGFGTERYKFLGKYKRCFKNFYYRDFYPPMGLLYIGSNMIKNGLEVDVLDLATCYPENIEKVVKKKCIGYDFIGISFFTYSYLMALKVAKICRQLNPDVKIVFGGPHASFDYEDILKNNFADYVISSEGEIAFTDLALGKCIEKIPNLRYKKNRVLKVNPIEPIKDLDSLPIPDVKLSKPIDMKYEGVYGVFTSRGCSRKCIYCVESRLFQNIRFRSAKNVVDEIENNAQIKNGEINIDVNDSNFFISKIHLRKISAEIIKRKLKVNLTCLGHVDDISGESLSALKKCGLSGMEMGVESLNSQNLNFINKTIDAENYRRKLIRIIKMCRKFEIHLIFNYILGLPDQTKEDVEKDVNFLNKFGEILPYILTPFPGTPLWSKYKKSLTIEDYEKLDSLHLVANESQLKPKDFKYFFEKILSKNNMKGMIFELDRKGIEKVMEILRFVGKR